MHGVDRGGGDQGRQPPDPAEQHLGVGELLAQAIGVLLELRRRAGPPGAQQGEAPPHHLRRMRELGLDAGRRLHLRLVDEVAQLRRGGGVEQAGLQRAGGGVHRLDRHPDQVAVVQGGVDAHLGQGAQVVGEPGPERRRAAHAAVLL
jgi:hypothetical protein